VIPSINDDLKDIAQIAHQVGGEGFEDMQPHELEELIESHAEELTEEDLEELNNEDDSEVEEEVIARSTLNHRPSLTATHILPHFRCKIIVLFTSKCFITKSI
jgi:hypothetical protein